MEFFTVELLNLHAYRPRSDKDESLPGSWAKKEFFRAQVLGKEGSLQGATDISRNSWGSNQYPQEFLRIELKSPRNSTGVT